ncbi:potassium channel family protein [Nocardia sp. NPDC046473]|uniref:potassium channel family protein n=1 Tax=Nocardia sp. NPDC046473 TaxID=3155733 RepID=UPI0033C75C02
MPTGENSSTGNRRRPARRGVLFAVAAVIALSVAYFLLPFTRIGDIRTVLLLIAGAVAICAIFAWQIRGVLRAEHPLARAVEAAVAIFGCYIIGCATVYYTLSAGEPTSFSESLTKLDALYFGVTVFATVGFGDIVATSQPARAVVLAQMIGNLILIGLALRLLTASVELRRTQLRAPEQARPADQE